MGCGLWAVGCVVLCSVVSEKVYATDTMINWPVATRTSGRDAGALLKETMTGRPECRESEGGFQPGLLGSRSCLLAAVLAVFGCTYLINDSARGALSLVSPTVGFCGVSGPAADWAHAELRQRFSLPTAHVRAPQRAPAGSWPHRLAVVARVPIRQASPAWVWHAALGNCMRMLTFLLVDSIARSCLCLALAIAARDGCPEVGGVLVWSFAGATQLAS
ncbi:hypothetical protein F5Y12DRAFT_484014 [Xylaria sp. FL1777]|nr:hypothetical protein F5Y12DRAFT_484014 [Xylaria sp. FL1777]